jgi:hypothetical protein
LRTTTVPGPPAKCAAAAGKLRDAETNKFILLLTVNRLGKVEWFRSESPSKLRLEKIKDVADEIKAMHFDPAKNDGQPVRALIKIEFSCPSSGSKAPKRR